MADLIYTNSYIGHWMCNKRVEIGGLALPISDGPMETLE